MSDGSNRINLPSPMHTIAALYKFASIGDREAVQALLLGICKTNDVRGTFLVAGEGLNGTISGTEIGIENTLAFIRTLPGLAELDVKYSQSTNPPFTRLKVRLKSEIVKLGVGDLKPATNAGIHVEPSEWNALIDKPETVVIDTRNAYETRLGTFAGAIDPNTEAFGDLPDWVAENLDVDRRTPIAMFCTGGIRCEKSTAYLRQQGFENVYHLKGGILNYLEQVPEHDSRWQGECFVFDERVSVGHGLKVGANTLCHACKMPLTPDEQANSRTVPGIACPHCHDTLTDEQRARFTERQRQMDLSKQRGTTHIASDLEAARRTKHAARQAQREKSAAEGERAPVGPFAVDP